jgi:hypothetical protein
MLIFQDHLSWRAAVPAGPIIGAVIMENHQILV